MNARKPMNTRFLYFAYGANLCEAAMLERCTAAGVKKIGPATLPGYRLEFCRDDHGFGVANVARARAHQVPGGLWRIGRKCVAALDTYEACPRVYVRKWVDVSASGREVRAMTYMLRDKRPPAAPDPDYVNTILRGYADFGLDEKILLKAVSRTRPAGHTFSPLP